MPSVAWRWNLTDIKYAVFGDTHFLHRRTPTQELIENFAQVFNNYKPSIFTQCKIIFNAGDLFDRVTEAEDDDYLRAVAWKTRFMQYCSDYGIKMRDLKGTPSHDGLQQEMFPILAKNFPNLDYKYIDDISIEYMPDLGIHVLYVPDECRATNREIYDDVQTLLHEKGLAQVDIAIMHGAFQFQVNYDSNSNRLHFEDDYLSIVKHYINIAHIHTSKVYGRILGQGSFGRLSHNEEEDKGLMIMDINTDDPSKDRFTFVVNKHAKHYVTIKLHKDDVQLSLDKIQKRVANTPNGSYVRILCKMTHPFYSGFAEIKSRFPHLHMSRDRLDKKISTQVSDLFASTGDSYIPLQIDATNVVSLIMERMPKTHGTMSLLNLQSELSALL